MIKIIISIFLLGLSFGFGPCVSSCGPLLISYIAGTNKGILKGLKVYLLFSLSRIAAYIMLALLIFFFGRFAQERVFGLNLFKYVFIAGGVFIILVGLLMVIGRSLDIGLYRFLQRNFLERDNKSILLFGLVVGFMPCAPLVAVLSYIGLISKSWGEGAIYSLSFGIGTFISPLLLLAVFAGFIPRFLAGIKPVYQAIFRVICGLIIIFLGVQLLGRGF